MNFSRNESPTDRAIRFLLAVALGVVAVTGLVAAPWTYVLGIVAAVLAFTAITGFCAIYAVFGLSTKAAR
jgi:Inner membrane protein YgaP-like, transmembrane domain